MREELIKLAEERDVELAQRERDYRLFKCKNGRAILGILKNYVICPVNYVFVPSITRDNYFRVCPVFRPQFCAVLGPIRKPNSGLKF